MAIHRKARAAKVALLDALLPQHHLPKYFTPHYLHLIIMFRNLSANNLTDVVAKYIYFEEGKEPTPEDIVKSEILEGRIREGFVRIRQLLVSTQPYSQPFIYIYIYKD